MADVRIDYQLAQYEALGVDVHLDNDRPDALDDITARARHLFRDTLEDVYAVTVERGNAGSREK